MTTEHYFTAQPSGPARRRHVEFEINGRQYRMATAAGVFSADRLDLGTSVLLRKVAAPEADTTGALLDLGCGYGPIAVVLATVAPRATVYAVDVNARAVELARENAEALGLADRMVVAHPDEVPEDVTFTQIWANPPIRIGKDELHAMLERWLPRLAVDGLAWLVVSRNLGGDSLHQWLTDHGWPTHRHASQKGYRILRVQSMRRR